jgi:hypothetical protein
MKILEAGLGLLLVLFPSPVLSQDDPALAEKARRHQSDVTALRGLDFKSEVDVGVYTKKELLDFLKSELDRQLPTEKAVRFQRGYAKFGLVPDDLDVHASLVDLFGEAVAGFYDPSSKKLKLVRGGQASGLEAKALKLLGIDLEAVTLVHELTHAAQDQHFDLATLPLEDETNDDLVLALKGVIEGDASAVGWKFALGDTFDATIGLINGQYKAAALPGKAGRLPAYLRQTLTFPYGHGTDFVLACLRADGRTLRDASKLLEDPPLSTEQILHPEKYAGERDHPQLVTLPDLAALFGDPWKATMNNVHGEFVVGILLRELSRGGAGALSAAEIRDASEGWDGDRYGILENGAGKVLAVWFSTWDTEDDAREFHRAYARALERRYGIAPAGGGDRLAFGEGVLLERRGADVLLIDGAGVDRADRVWEGTRKAEMKKVRRVKKKAPYYSP